MLPIRLLSRLSVRQCITARVASINQLDGYDHQRQLIYVRTMTTLEVSSKELNDTTTRIVPAKDLPDLTQVLSDQTDSSITKIKVIPRRQTAQSIMSSLDSVFNRFVDTCQNSERVLQVNFVKTFDYLTKAIRKLEDSDQLNENIKSNLSVMCAILLRCCGEIMHETPEKHRELLAGNLWHFMKEKDIPIDTSHYNALLRVLNENSTNYDPQKMLDEMEQNNFFPDKITYQRLIHQYCLQGDVISATKLLEVMKSKNFELNEATFASLITGYSKQEEPPSSTELFELMKSSGIEPGSKSIAAAVMSQIKLLGKNPAANDELEKIYNLMKQEDIQFSSSDSIKLQTELSVIQENEIVNNIKRYITENANINTYNDQYKLIGSLLKIGEYDEASKIYWSLKPTSRALKYSNLGRFYISLLAQHTLVPVEFVIDECTKLRESGYNASAFIHLLFEAANKRNIPLVRATLNKLKEEGTPKCQFYWPLLANATDFETVVKILKEDLDPTMNQEDLLDTFTMWVWPKCFEETSKLFELNRDELHYDNQILLASLVQYSVQTEKIIDAVKFISESNLEIFSSPNSSALEVNVDEEEVTNETNRSNRRVDMRTKMFERLLEATAKETKDPEMVNKAFSLCNLAPEQLNSGTLKALVEVHILNGNYDKAIEEFLRLADQNRTTPCKIDLIKYCLETKDPNNLQKIMDVSNKIYGEANSLFDLAIACIECGKDKQAQKILASPGFRVNPVRIYRQARLLANRPELSNLEKFVHLARDLPDVDQEVLYQILISSYERTSNAHRILDLWNRMQEEEFHPSKRSLMMIADALEKNHIKVPFRKPSATLED